MGGEGTRERRGRGEERNKANPINKAGGGGETRRLKINNQLMIITISSASGHCGRLRAGKRWQWVREQVNGGGGGRSMTITCHQ